MKRSGPTDVQARLLVTACLALIAACHTGCRVETAVPDKKVTGESPQPDVGQVAPEIVGADVDEVEFRLSDYRGKVVALVFWGDW